MAESAEVKFVALANRTPGMVHSSSSVGYSNQDGLIGTDYYEFFPSSSDATAMFDEQLKLSTYLVCTKSVNPTHRSG